MLGPAVPFVIVTEIMSGSGLTCCDVESGLCLLRIMLGHFSLILVLISFTFLFKTKYFSPSGTLAHNGHRLPWGDHSFWLGIDGRSRQDLPWEGSKARFQDRHVEITAPHKSPILTVHSSVFSKHTELCLHQHNLILEYFHHPPPTHPHVHSG